MLHIHRVLHAALERARKWKLIGENPAKDASAPSPQKARVKNFDAGQVEKLLAAARRDPETYVITALFLACGPRRSEVLGLAFDCVDLDGATLTIRRTVVEVGHAPVLREQAKTDGSERTIAIPAALVDLLREQKTRVQATALKWGKGYRRDPLFVFPGLAGEPMTPMSLTLRMRQVMRRARVEGLSPCHAWRHTSATALIHAGQNIKTVQARLGHSTPAITMAFTSTRPRKPIGRPPTISARSSSDDRTGNKPSACQSRANFCSEKIAKDRGGEIRRKDEKPYASNS